MTELSGLGAGGYKQALRLEMDQRPVPTTGRPHWRCPDCGERCKCDPALYGTPHVRCGHTAAQKKAYDA